MIDASIELANSVYNWAYAALILGAVFTVVGLVSLFWAEGIRAKHHSLEIAQANQKAAEANQKAEEERLARVKIEERLAPRSISDAQFNALLRKLPAHAGISVDMLQYCESPEITNFAAQ